MADFQNALLTSPLEEIRSFNQYAIRVLIKRDDQIHPFVSGNKWRKLKYNLARAKELGKSTLLTFGGAFSNHIYSTSAAGREFGFKTIGLIRGEETLPLNPTLSFAKEQGMELHYIERARYRDKDSLEMLADLKEQFGDFYFIPEGGSNSYALAGVKELLDEITVPFDYILTPVGTGGTLAGLAAGLKPGQEAMGFAALAGREYLETEVEKLLQAANENCGGSWSINHNYHCGGYAKISKVLVEFMNQFEKENKILLDPLYTGKMMFGLFDMLKKGLFEKGKTIIVLHTGGLQGIEGMKGKMNNILR